MSALFSAWTVLVAIVFIGIVVWVFRADKKDFDEAARMPLEEDDPPSNQMKEEEDHA